MSTALIFNLLYGKLSDPCRGPALACSPASKAVIRALSPFIQHLLADAATHMMF